MQKYQEVFDGVKEIIKKMNDNYMRIRFITDDNIPPNKIIYVPTITITIRSVTKKVINSILNFSWMIVYMKYKNANI